MVFAELPGEGTELNELFTRVAELEDQLNNQQQVSDLSIGTGATSIESFAAVNTGLTSLFALDPLDQEITKLLTPAGEIDAAHTNAIVSHATDDPLNLYYLENPAHDGQIKILHPENGKILNINSGGNFANASTITINDGFFTLMLYSEENGNKWLPLQTASGVGDNLGNHTATIDLDLVQNKIVDVDSMDFDAGGLFKIDGGVANNGIAFSLPTTRAFGFYITNLVTPKLGITETSIFYSVDIDLNERDIFDIDRLRFVSSSAAPTSASDPSIYLDGVSNMVFNLDDQKQWFWTNFNQTIMQLDRTGVNNDTVLTIETDFSDASAVPRIDIFRDDPSPAINDDIGLIRFIGTDAALNSQVYSQIATEYMNVTDGREASNMIFVVSYDTGAATQFVPFMGLNLTNSNQIAMLKDTNFSADIYMNTNSIFLDNDGDSGIFSASDDVLQFFTSTIIRFAIEDSLISAGSELTMLANPITNITYEDFDEIVTPANPAANHVRLYGKLDGGFTKLFYKQENGTEVGPLGTAGGGGSQTPWIADIDADGFDLKDLSNIEFRNTTGAPGSTVASMYADAGGININVPIGDVITFKFSGSDNVFIDDDEIRFGSGRAHRLVASSTAFQIDSENTSDTIEFRNGTSRTFPTFEIDDGASVFYTNTTSTAPYSFEFIQNHDTPSANRGIVQINALAENSVSADTIYGRIDFSTGGSILSGDESGRVQIEVRTNGNLVNVLECEGDTVSNTGKLGFYSHSTIALQTGVAVSASAIHAALVALGLITA